MMLSNEKGAFCLDYSLYASFFRWWRTLLVERGLASNVAKDFNGLNSIFCLSNSDKVSSI
jgi:hypothetical protein